MPRRLSEEESRQRHAEGRKLWNEFDPERVAEYSDYEYEEYVGPCLKIVESWQGGPVLLAYVRWAVFEHMGMGQTPELDVLTERFATRFSAWYRTDWPDTLS